MSIYTAARDAVKETTSGRHAATRVVEFSIAMAVVSNLLKCKNSDTAMNDTFSNEAAAVALGYGKFIEGSPIRDIPEVKAYALYDSKASSKFQTEYAALKEAVRIFSRSEDDELSLLAARTRLLMRFF